MLKFEISKYLAQRHIAGPVLNDALIICKRASEYGWSNIISVWGMAKVNPEESTAKYIDILKSIIDDNLDSYLSIKPSSINFNMHLFELMACTAAMKNIRIHFDSLSPDLMDSYISFLKEAFACYGNLGFTLPSRWMRSIKDVDKISRFKIPVRVVKGQWQDPDNLKINSKKNFLNIISKLSNEVPLIAVATHDRILAEEAVNILEKNGSDYELEQFFSLPTIADKICVHHFGLKKRLYVVYGEPYLPYNLRNANKRPGMILWILRDVLHMKPYHAFEISNSKTFQNEYHEITPN